MVGAYNNPGVSGYNFTVPFLMYGYQGKIYPVNPKYSEVLGITAYSSIREIPGSVDYVISCVPAAEVLNMLEDCSQKGVKCIHLFTARFSETGGRQAADRDHEILKQARKRWHRLIGPDWEGVQYPNVRISFCTDLSMEPGSAGAAAHSGGFTSELARLAPLRVVYFSKAISYGNAIDFNECDYLEYFSQDPETKLIMMYVEGVRDGKRFFNTLSQAASTKPVIIMKGGRGKSGTRAVASHTASLAGSMKIWETLVPQAGAVSAESIDEMIDLAV